MLTLDINTEYFLDHMNLKLIVAKAKLTVFAQTCSLSYISSPITDITIHLVTYLSRK